MRIGMVINQPEANLQHETGYSGYVRRLVRTLREMEHEVEIVSLPFYVEQKVEFPDVVAKAQANKTLYEIEALESPTVAEFWLRLLRTYDKLIVNFPVMVPIGLHKELGAEKIIFVIHDPGFLDPMFGRTGSGLRNFDNWHTASMYNVMHMRDIERMYAMQMPDVGLQVTSQQLRVFADACLNMLTSVRVQTIAPTIEVAKLVTSAQARAAGNVRVLPHATSSKLHRLPLGGMSDAAILTVASWDKLNLPMYLSVVAEMPRQNFTLLAHDEVIERHLNWQFAIHGQPRNLDLQRLMPHDQFMRRLSGQDFCVCFHPSAIFETFGYVPYEMAQYGIPTAYEDGFTGLQSAIDSVGATPVKSVQEAVDILKDMVYNPGHYVPSACAQRHLTDMRYAQLLLEGKTWQG